LRTDGRQLTTVFNSVVGRPTTVDLKNREGVQLREQVRRPAM